MANEPSSELRFDKVWVVTNALHLASMHLKGTGTRHAVNCDRSMTRIRSTKNKRKSTS